MSDADYAELSTKFKACHVKNMIFWIARKTHEVADAAPEVSKSELHQQLYFFGIPLLAIRAASPQQTPCHNMFSS